MKPKTNLTLTPGNAAAVAQYAELIGMTPLCRQRTHPARSSDLHELARNAIM
jgi:hypothetical protein